MSVGPHLNCHYVLRCVVTRCLADSHSSPEAAALLPKTIHCAIRDASQARAENRDIVIARQLAVKYSSPNLIRQPSLNLLVKRHGVYMQFGWNFATWFPALHFCAITIGSAMEFAFSRVKNERCFHIRRPVSINKPAF